MDTGRSLLAGAALALLGMGCSSNPLVGTWATPITVGTLTLTDTLDVSSDGTLSVTDATTSTSCSGSWTTTGYTWSSTATAVVFSGTPVCTGSITCGNVSLACSGSNGALKVGSCAYTLTSNDDTLALTACTGTSDTTFTRED